MEKYLASEKLMLLAMILIPFNSLPYFRSMLGEFSNEGSFYPILALVATAVATCKVQMPNKKNTYLGAAFLFSLLFSSLCNAEYIFMATNKGRSGIEKLLLQSMVLAFAALVALSCYGLFSRKNGIEVLRRGILWSLPVPLFVGWLEILSDYFSSGAARAVLDAVSNLIFDPEAAEYAVGRIRTVSGEASWFAMYVGFILPWVLFERDLAAGRKRVLLSLAVLNLFLLVILSQSRTAYFSIFVELVLYGFLSSKALRGRVLFKAFVMTASCISLLSAITLDDQNLLGVFTSVGDVEENLSNIGRFGSQVAAWDMAKDHWMGVGLGQFGFYAAQYYPDFTWISTEVQLWADSSSGTAWPPVHSIYLRILSEAGWVGLFLWLSLWFAVLTDLWKSCRALTRSDDTSRICFAGIFASVVGVLMSGFNSDSFRFFPYWIMLALCWSISANPQLLVRDLETMTCA